MSNTVWSRYFLREQRRVGSFQNPLWPKQQRDSNELPRQVADNQRLVKKRKGVEENGKDERV